MDGCETVQEDQNIEQKSGQNSDLSLVTCHCTHLTYFGLLLDIYGLKDNMKYESGEYQALNNATTIGCLMSIIACLMTTFTYVFGSDKLLGSYLGGLDFGSIFGVKTSFFIT